MNGCGECYVKNSVLCIIVVKVMPFIVKKSCVIFLLRTVIVHVAIVCVMFYMGTPPYTPFLGVNCNRSPFCLIRWHVIVLLTLQAYAEWKVSQLGCYDFLFGYRILAKTSGKCYLWNVTLFWDQACDKLCVSYGYEWCCDLWVVSWIQPRLCSWPVQDLHDPINKQMARSSC